MSVSLKEMMFYKLRIAIESTFSELHDMATFIEGTWTHSACIYRAHKNKNKEVPWITRPNAIMNIEITYLFCYFTMQHEINWTLIES